MIVYREYKYRIYPNDTQQKLIQSTFGCVRWVYNYFLSERIRLYSENKTRTNFYEECVKLTELKTQNQWLKEPDKNALQCALKDLSNAYERFFCGLEKNKRVGFPKFKKKKSSKKTYRTWNNNGRSIRTDSGSIYLPKLKRVKAKIHRELPIGCRVISACVSQTTSGKYFASIMIEKEIAQDNAILNVDNSIGLDYSSPHFYVDSEGNIADMPHFFREEESKLAREQRKLSRMVRGSKNYEKQKIKIAKIYERISNRRNDWQQKESATIANRYDIVCVEGINYRSLEMNRHISKSTKDNSFGQFRYMLKYKMEEKGKMLITIDKWFPSSKKCRFCGEINSNLDIKQRYWECSCGASIDRDVNAAINIRNEGIKSLC